MAQVTIYLPDDVEAQVRLVAKAEGASVGRWIAQQVAAKVESTWSPAVLAALGSFPDFPDLETIREGYGADAPREALD
jgi:hypothetical protein